MLPSGQCYLTYILPTSKPRPAQRRPQRRAGSCSRPITAGFLATRGQSACHWESRRPRSLVRHSRQPQSWQTPTPGSPQSLPSPPKSPKVRSRPGCNAPRQAESSSRPPCLYHKDWPPANRDEMKKIGPVPRGVGAARERAHGTLEHGPFGWPARRSPLTP